MHTRLPSTIAIGLLLASGVLADPLPPLHEEALAGNPKLASARKGWEQAQQRIGPSGSLPDPMVGLNLMRGSTRLDDYSELEYMASQELPWWGTRRALREAKRLEAEAEGFLYLEEIRQTRREVTAAAWRLWLAREALAINAEQIRWISALRDSAKARYENSQGPQSELLRADVELAREQKRRADLEQDEALALTELNRALGSPPQTPRDLGTLSDPSTPLRPIEDYMARANAFCCTLLSFERRMEAQRAMAEAVRKESAPMLQLFVAARQPNGESGIQEVDTGIALSLPWDQRGKYRARRAEARLAFERSEAELEMEILATQTETHAAYAMADKARRQRALLEKEVLPQLDRLIASTRSAYASGDMPLLEALDAERMRQEALLELAMARAEYAQACAMLDALTGPYLQPELDTGLVTEANNPPWDEP